MKNVLWICLMLFMLVGCGERVTINTGEVGKQLGVSGLEDEIRDPGSFRMDTCYFSACLRLIRLETAVSAREISIDQIFLPKSNVALDKITFGIQYRVREDKKSMNLAFKTLPTQPIVHSDHERIITSDTVFNTYIARKAPETVIVALRNYTIEQSMGNVDEISNYVKEALNSSLKDTPIEITEFGFPNGIGTPPRIVLEAKEKLYAIDEDRARKVKALKAELVVEEQRQAVQARRGLSDKSNAEALGIPVDQYIILKSFERFADAAENGTPVAIGAGVMPISRGEK